MAKKTSRQWKWQMKQRAAGNCITCGAPVCGSKTWCARHAIVHRNICRAHAGCSARVLGRATIDHAEAYAAARAEVARRYAAGEPSASIAADFGRSPSNIVSIARAEGCTIRPRGTRQKSL